MNVLEDRVRMKRVGKKVRYREERDDIDRSREQREMGRKRDGAYVSMCACGWVVHNKKR